VSMHPFGAFIHQLIQFSKEATLLFDPILLIFNAQDIFLVAVQTVFLLLVKDVIAVLHGDRSVFSGDLDVDWEGCGWVVYGYVCTWAIPQIIT